MPHRHRRSSDRPTSRWEVEPFMGPISMIIGALARPSNEQDPLMHDPRYQTFPDGTAVVFNQHARQAMHPSSAIQHPLETPAAGADAVYTVTNTDDSFHDVILNETQQRYGVAWLEPAEPVPVTIVDEEDPDEEIERRVREYDGSVTGLFDLLGQLWGRDYGDLVEHNIGDDVRILSFVTGGWSHNETVMYALQAHKRVAHALTWVSSHRGGLHVYEITHPIGQLEIG